MLTYSRIAHEVLGLPKDTSVHESLIMILRPTVAKAEPVHL